MTNEALTPGAGRWFDDTCPPAEEAQAIGQVEVAKDAERHHGGRPGGNRCGSQVVETSRTAAVNEPVNSFIEAGCEQGDEAALSSTFQFDSFRPPVAQQRDRSHDVNHPSAQVAPVEHKTVGVEHVIPAIGFEEIGCRGYGHGFTQPPDVEDPIADPASSQFLHAVEVWQDEANGFFTFEVEAGKVCGAFENGEDSRFRFHGKAFDHAVLFPNPHVIAGPEMAIVRNAAHVFHA